MGCRPTVFHIEGTPPPRPAGREPKRFLGRPTGFRLLPDQASLDQTVRVGTDLLSSALAPWQRLDALKSCFYPSLQYEMTTAQRKKTQWRKVDTTLRPLIKYTLYLPREATNSYLQGDVKKGLFGIPEAALDSDIAAIDSAFKLLTSRDPRVKDLTWAGLKDFTAACIHRQPSMDDLCHFLSRSAALHCSHPTTSTGSRAQAALDRLGVTWELTEEREVAIVLGSTTITDGRKVFQLLRWLFRTSHAEDLAVMPHQGKTHPCLSQSKASTHFHREGNFSRFADWRFVHRARLGLVPLNAYKHGPNNCKRCRKCGSPLEILPHVICHCRQFSRQWTARHNKVVDRLVKAASERWEVYSENRPLMGSNLRPDIVLRKDDNFLLLDVTVCFDNGQEAFDAARRRKEEKYAPLVETLPIRISHMSQRALESPTIMAEETAVYPSRNFVHGTTASKLIVPGASQFTALAFPRNVAYTSVTTKEVIKEHFSFRNHGIQMPKFRRLRKGGQAMDFGTLRERETFITFVGEIPELKNFIRFVSPGQVTHE
ncbi:uncharacterized protein LOC129230414 [Uloborus diversus]|uniref:uncharacterized protein LOC129230414 n=1 Tax=Uloborus diversus TaxID=327109 RepID=UPI00240A25C2|nr:uncharacterized protein LOC129230414 [Uloborus diversus]